MVERSFGARAIALVRGDITREESDAVVNAANPALLGGGGVDGAIHRAGGPAILEECLRIRERQGGCETGEAVVTTGGRLKARYVIHTVGPVWRGGGRGEAALLASCYRNALRLAGAMGLASVSFPSIGTGAYGYPVSGAAAVALGTVARFLREEEAAPSRVRFVLFDEATFGAYRAALEEL